MKLRKDKKGVIGISEVPGAVLLLVTIGIFLAVGAIILTQIQSNELIAAGSDAFNATDDALGGLDTLSSFQTVIAVVVAAAVILGVVFLIRA